MPVTPTNPIDVHAQPLYWGKPLSELWDMELVQAHQYCVAAEKKREEASKHSKFQDGKLKLPPINQQFAILKQSIINEIQKRGLTI